MASYYKPDWVGGTITLTSGSKAFTVADVDLSAISVQPGDEIYHTTTGRWLIIDEVTSATGGNLAYNCPADLAGAALPLRIRFQADGSRFAAAYLNALQKFKGGNLDALAGLTGAADELAYFTGAGAMDVTAFKAAMRIMLGLTAAADQMVYFKDDGSGGIAPDLTTVTAMARALLDDANAATMLTTLGVSSFAQSLLDDANAAVALATLGALAQDGSRPLTGTLTSRAPANNTWSIQEVTGVSLADQAALRFDEISGSPQIGYLFIYDRTRGSIALVALGYKVESIIYQDSSNFVVGAAGNNLIGYASGGYHYLFNDNGRTETYTIISLRLY